LLDHIKKYSPNFFERLVVELLVKMGYGGSREDAGKAIGKRGDEDIDGIKPFSNSINTLFFAVTLRL